MLEKISSKIVNIIDKNTDKIGDKLVRGVKNDFTRSPEKDVIIKNSTNQVSSAKILDEILKAKREFCSNFLAKNPRIENVIKKADIEYFGREGLPLKYPRDSFINDFNKATKHAADDYKRDLFRKLEITPKFDEQQNFISYEGFPALKTLDAKNPLHQKASVIVNKFLNENEVISNDPALNKTMNSVLKEFPEYVNIIGKKQHKDQAFSVDVHILKVLKGAMNHPEYEKLSDKDKTVMKMVILFHDIAKIEGIVDKGHQELSALYTKKLIKRINMPQEMKDRIFELVKNHHWLEEYNLDMAKPENIGKVRATPENIASRFRNPVDYTISKIFAESDLKGVSDDFFIKYGGALSPERQFPIEEALKKIHNAGNVILTSRIVTPSRIPKVQFGDRTYKVLNLTEISDAQDMEKFGFVRGTKKDDLRFLAHFLQDDNLLNTAKATEAVSEVEIGGVFSSSLLSLKNKKSYCGTKYGFTLNTENSNLAAALNYDMYSGDQKRFEAFSNYLHGSKTERTFLKENLVDALEEKYDYISSEEYGDLFKKIMDKKHITQIKDVNIGEQTLKGEDLKSAITKAQDELFRFRSGERGWNEVIVYNPKISAVICKEDKMEKVPDVMLDFAHSRKLPIILIGE